MGKLVNVQKAIEAKKKAGQQKEEIVPALAALEGLIADLRKPSVSPEDFSKGLTRLTQGMVAIVKRIEASQKALQAEVDKDRTAPVVEAVNGLKSDLKSLRDEIMGISIPAPVVNIPETKIPETDLSPIYKEFDALTNLVASMKPATVEVPSPGPQKEWVFDVKRNQAGYIQKIEARQV